MDKFYYKQEADGRNKDKCNHMPDVMIGSYYCSRMCYIKDNATFGEDKNGKFIICRNAYKTID